MPGEASSSSFIGLPFPPLSGGFSRLLSILLCNRGRFPLENIRGGVAWREGIHQYQSRDSGLPQISIKYFTCLSYQLKESVKTIEITSNLLTKLPLFLARTCSMTFHLLTLGQ